MRNRTVSNSRAAPTDAKEGMAEAHGESVSSGARVRAGTGITAPGHTRAEGVLNRALMMLVERGVTEGEATTRETTDKEAGTWVVMETEIREMGTDRDGETPGTTHRTNSHGARSTSSKDITRIAGKSPKGTRDSIPLMEEDIRFIPTGGNMYNILPDLQPSTYNNPLHPQHHHHHHHHHHKRLRRKIRVLRDREDSKNS